VKTNIHYLVVLDGICTFSSLRCKVVYAYQQLPCFLLKSVLFSESTPNLIFCHCINHCVNVKVSFGSPILFAVLAWGHVMTQLVEALKPEGRRYDS
jgi:hypothetical protein